MTFSYMNRCNSFRTVDRYTMWEIFCPGVKDVFNASQKLKGQQGNLLSSEVSRMEVTHPGNEVQDLLSECPSKLFPWKRSTRPIVQLVHWYKVYHEARDLLSVCTLGPIKEHSGTQQGIAGDDASLVTWNAFSIHWLFEKTEACHKLSYLWKLV